jgi:hypothetical protein
MTKDCLLHWARRHLRWLLCFAMLLPAAQLAGAAHAFSHLNASTQQQRDDGASVDLHCGLCVVAAAIGGGGLPSTAALLPPDLAPAARAAAALIATVHLAPQRRPTNRGPPSLLA